MIIPTKLKIGAHLITIDCSQDLKGEMFGEYLPNEDKIRICKSLSQSQKEATLIHEVFHVINACFDEDFAHALLESLSQQFYQVLIDNDLLK